MEFDIYKEIWNIMEVNFLEPMVDAWAKAEIFQNPKHKK